MHKSLIKYCSFFLQKSNFAIKNFNEIFKGKDEFPLSINNVVKT